MCDWQVQNVVDAVKTAISALLQDPSTRVQELNLTGPLSLSQLGKWNGTRANMIKIHSCVHHEFVRQSLKQPQAPVIVAWDGSMTY